MHHFLINASLQLLPVGGEKHPYEWVDEAIAIIKKSGLKADVGAFTTVVEGAYAEVLRVINEINEYLYEYKCQEWILGVQMHIRSASDITSAEKVDKHK